MADKIKLNASSLTLTKAEFDYLESLVKGGDRVGFYLAYYSMAVSNDRAEANGSTEMALQAKIASFSDDVGGVAFFSNRLLQEAFGPSGYNGIYYLSQQVAEQALAVIDDDRKGEGTDDGQHDGIASDSRIFDSARKAWETAGQRTQFPGNLLDDPTQARSAGEAVVNWFRSIYDGGGTVSRADFVSHLAGVANPGAAAAFLTAAYAATLVISPGKRISDYQGNSAYDIVTIWDGQLQVAIDKSTKKVVAVGDSGLGLSQRFDEIMLDFSSYVTNALAPTIAEQFRNVLGAVFQPYAPPGGDWRRLTESTTPGTYDGDNNAPGKENSFVHGPEHVYRSAATPNDDVLQGSNSTLSFGGNDSINGLGGKDLIYGGGGEDTIDGGADDDIIWGQWGEDSLTGGDGNDVLRGGAGDDTFIGGQGSDTIDGGDILTKRVDDGSDQIDYSKLGGKVTVHIRDAARNNAVFEGDLSKLGTHSGVVDKGEGGAMGVDAFTSIETIAFGTFDNVIQFGTSTIPAPKDTPLKLNFKLDGATQPLKQTIELRHLNGGGIADRATDAIFGVDGKQLVGGAAFDFDKFDRTSGAISFFVDMLNTPTSPPYVTGSLPYGISTTDRMQEWLGKHIETHNEFVGRFVPTAGVGTGVLPGIGLMVLAAFIPLLYADLVHLAESIEEIYHQEIIGTQGEHYTLSNASYDAAGRVTSADLTITLNPSMADAYTIKVDGWKQGDLGIRIENLKWREGLETGTNKNGQLDTWQDLSLELVRQKLAGLGFQPREWEDAQAAAARNPNPTPKGVSQEGTDAADAISGASGDDLINGHKGNDTLAGGEGRDEYVFRAGDGADVVSDLSAEGNIVRFLDGLDPATMQRSLVSGENGAQDLLISYGAGDSLRIVGWSGLKAEQQALWTFEGVRADISSPVSAKTPDISVLPVGGSGPTRLTGTAAADILNGGAGDDRINALDGDDLLIGGTGRDIANGGSGADTIVGGQGDDRLDGGDGADTFRFFIGDGDDTLSDPDSGGFFDTVDFDVLQFGEGWPAPIRWPRFEVSASSAA